MVLSLACGWLQSGNSQKYGCLRFGGDFHPLALAIDGFWRALSAAGTMPCGGAKCLAFGWRKVGKASLSSLKNLSSTENERNQSVMSDKEVFKKDQHFRKWMEVGGVSSF